VRPGSAISRSGSSSRPGKNEHGLPTAPLAMPRMPSSALPLETSSTAPGTAPAVSATTLHKGRCRSRTAISAPTPAAGAARSVVRDRREQPNGDDAKGGGPQQRSDRYGLCSNPRAQPQIPPQQDRDGKRAQCPPVQLRAVWVAHEQGPVSRAGPGPAFGRNPMAANGAPMIGSSVAARPASSRCVVARDL
jgi:hypothetical protein